MDCTLTPKQAKEAYGVSSYQTLINWADSGKIKFKWTGGRHRRYAPPETKVSAEPEDLGLFVRQQWVYCRVSSSKQKEDLDRQVYFLKNLYPNANIIADVGSSFNFERKGLKRLLDNVDKGEVGELVVAHKDRLARAGFGLIQFLLERKGVILTILNDSRKSSVEEDAEDLLAIITHFSAKFHGRRKYKAREAEAKNGGAGVKGKGDSNTKDKVLPNTESEDAFVRVLSNIEILLQQNFSMDRRAKETYSDSD